VHSCIEALASGHRPGALLQLHRAQPAQLPPHRVVVTAVTAYLSVRFLMRYFQTSTLTPFAIYCLVFGAASIVHFAL